ncbi:MAG: hypothetical protein IPH03_10695 [Tetrasphaera sp.]|nr:hypothetical protein [Tetrasphaera sp.]
MPSDVAAGPPADTRHHAIQPTQANQSSETKGGSHERVPPTHKPEIPDNSVPEEAANGPPGETGGSHPGRHRERAVPLNTRAAAPSPGIWLRTLRIATAPGGPRRDPDECVTIGDDLIFDSIGFGDFVLDPDEDPEIVARVAAGIAEHGEVFGFWAKLHDADEGMRSFQSTTSAPVPSPGAWAEAEFQRLAERAGIPEAKLKQSGDIDGWSFEEIAQQLWLEGELFIAHRDGGGVWLFRTNL